MAERRITLGCRLAGEKRVPHPDDADKAVAEQRLHAHFRPRVAEHADVEVHQPLPQRPRVLVGLGGEAQAHARSCGHGRHDQPRGEGLSETLIGPYREGSLKGGEVQSRNRWPQCSASLMNEIPHAQQRIAGRRAQPRQSPAHRRRAEPQPAGRHAAVRQQSVERGQKVQVRVWHG